MTLLQGGTPIAGSSLPEPRQVSGEPDPVGGREVHPCDLFARYHWL